MFGRKKLKKEIEELKREISFLNNKPVPIETTKYDVDVISTILAMGVEAEKATEENIVYAKQSSVNSICEVLKRKDNIEDYIEFKQVIEDDGLFHMKAELKILKKRRNL